MEIWAGFIRFSLLSPPFLRLCSIHPGIRDFPFSREAAKVPPLCYYILYSTLSICDGDKRHFHFFLFSGKRAVTLSSSALIVVYSIDGDDFVEFRQKIPLPLLLLLPWDPLPGTRMNIIRFYSLFIRGGNPYLPPAIFSRGSRDYDV